MALLLPRLILVCFLMAVVSAGNFYRDFDILWGINERVKIFNNGHQLSLSLVDKDSGSAFRSKNQYLYGRVDMQIKLVPGDSAGTVATFYLSSHGPTHDEIDFEFLGNLSGDPYTIHTNLFAQGIGGREMQFKPWFDPTTDFHTYSILWNPKNIIFMVDGLPIRQFKNLESIGVAFPTSQPMSVYSSLWCADQWATQGGRIKTNWTEAPFVATSRNFRADACVVSSSGGSKCSSSKINWWDEELDSTSQEIMTFLQSNYMIYNYCTDLTRFPPGQLPPECSEP